MYRFLALLASLFLTATAWAQPVTFGASVQITGPVANTGRYYKDAYEFAVDKINAAGGIKIGSAHRKIALKILDNQSDVNLSVRQYVQLLSQDKVDFLLGPFASNFVLATSSIAEKARVPMVQGGGASDQIYSRGYQYIFGTLPAASNYFGSTIEAMTKLNPSPQTVALLYADDAFDVSVAKGTRGLLKKAGLKTVIDERYSTNASDFSVLLPVFLTVTVMPLTYSIANGIGAGFIGWVVVRSLAGKAREISPLLWVVAAGFLVYFARGPVEALLAS